MRAEAFRSEQDGKGVCGDLEQEKGDQVADSCQIALRGEMERDEDRSSAEKREEVDSHIVSHGPMEISLRRERTNEAASQGEQCDGEENGHRQLDGELVDWVKEMVGGETCHDRSDVRRGEYKSKGKIVNRLHRVTPVRLPMGSRSSSS